MVQKKYLNRNSPPFPAKSFPGEEKQGNDGKMYISTPNKNGVYSWKLVNKKNSKSDVVISTIPLEDVFQVVDYETAAREIESKDDFIFYRGDPNRIINGDTLFILDYDFSYEDHPDYYTNLSESPSSIVRKYKLELLRTNYIHDLTFDLYRITDTVYVGIKPGSMRGDYHIDAFMTNKSIVMFYKEYSNGSNGRYIQLKGENFPRDLYNVTFKGEFINRVNQLPDGTFSNASSEEYSVRRVPIRPELDVNSWRKIVQKDPFKLFELPIKYRTCTMYKKYYIDDDVVMLPHFCMDKKMVKDLLNDPTFDIYDFKYIPKKFLDADLYRLAYKKGAEPEFIPKQYIQ